MKQVTKTEYLAAFMNKDAVVSVPYEGTAEWALRSSRTVIARSVERISMEEGEPYTIIDYYINENI